MTKSRFPVTQTDAPPPLGVQSLSLVRSERWLAYTSYLLMVLFGGDPELSSYRIFVTQIGRTFSRRLTRSCAFLACSTHAIPAARSSFCGRGHRLFESPQDLLEERSMTFFPPFAPLFAVPLILNGQNQGRFADISLDVLFGRPFSPWSVRSLPLKKL